MKRLGGHGGHGVARPEGGNRMVRGGERVAKGGVDKGEGSILRLATVRLATVRLVPKRPNWQIRIFYTIYLLIKILCIQSCNNLPHCP